MVIPQRKPNREIEVKLRISDPAALLRRFNELHAQPSKSVFERNTLFDTPSRDFSRIGAILRIRTEVPATPSKGSPRLSPHRSKPIEGLLTYKGMLPRASNPRPRFKIREEIEYHLPNAARFERLLRRLGLAAWFRYEKFRTRYRLPRFPDLHLDLDQTPIGVFLELEGSKSDIDRAARLLGFGPSDYLPVSYLELYIAHCRQRRRKPSHMLFSSKKSLR